MKRKFRFLFALAIVGSLAMTPGENQTRAQRPAKRGSICGNPQLPCKTVGTFKPNDLPFRVPENSVIFDTELFYAVVLKSVRTTEDNCDVFVSEDDRLQAQSLFPENKVFASRCVDIENLFYTGVNPNVRILAVYAGTTLPEAQRMLAEVKAKGRYSGAFL